jgi:Mn2+/Fe2+ NRAMP family transporter
MIVLVLLLTSNRTVMGDAVNTPVLEVCEWAAFVVMTLAAAGLFVAA